MSRSAVCSPSGPGQARRCSRSHPFSLCGPACLDESAHALHGTLTVKEREGEGMRRRRKKEEEEEEEEEEEKQDGAG